MPKVLKFKGRPGQYIDGVGAHDLTDEDVLALPPHLTVDHLVATDLYARIGGSADALAEADAAHTADVKAQAPKRGG